MVYRHQPALLTQLPTAKPGIYTISGSRQIGKTTLLKQWMAKLLNEGVPAESIAFFTGELIDDHHALVRIIQNRLAQVSDDFLKYFIVDEISYVKDWDKAIKFLADAGVLENTILILTGSEISIIQEARMRFPGRRGEASEVDFHLYPLSFKEFVCLKHFHDKESENPSLGMLYEEFEHYLFHGGFLTAINEFAKNQTISKACLMTYSDWIRGDVLKRGKKESYLLEVLNAIVKCYGSQVTWHSLADTLSIDHPQTVADYVTLLSSMDAVFIQSALQEDKLIAAPKKAKKVIFTDPFIYHAIAAWINDSKDPFKDIILKNVQDPKINSKLVEACLVSHYRRFYPTFYIKSEGEVDIAYVKDKKFWPIEVKWTSQMRPKDLKQIKKYRNALILGKQKSEGEVDGVKIMPLPIILYHLQGEAQSPHA